MLIIVGEIVRLSPEIFISIFDFHLEVKNLDHKRALYYRIMKHFIRELHILSYPQHIIARRVIRWQWPHRYAQCDCCCCEEDQQYGNGRHGFLRLVLLSCMMIRTTTGAAYTNELKEREMGFV